MYKNKKVIVVLPAYNAAQTLEKTYREIPFDLVDEVILCDDASSDNTSDLAREIGITHVITHVQNKGYGGNQKSLYNKALELGGDIIIMLHPDMKFYFLCNPPKTKQLEFCDNAECVLFKDIGRLKDG